MKTLYFTFILMLLATCIFSCDNEDNNYVDYDFNIRLKFPEQLSIDEPFTLNLLISNADSKNTEDIILSIKNIENINISYQGKNISETDRTTINYYNTENIPLKINQKSIKEDSIIFIITNSQLSKEIGYKINISDYKGLVSINSSGGGEISGLKPKYNYDDEVLITATPYENKKFLGWFDSNGKLLCSDFTYQFKFQKSIILCPQFETGVAKITIPKTSGGTTTGAGDYSYGEDVVLNALPEEGRKFIGWYENDQLISDTKILLFKASKDRTIEARFKESYFYVELLGDTDNLNINGAGKYIEGTEVQISISLKNNNGQFVGLYEGEKLISTNPSYSFTITNNVTLKALFKKFLTLNANSSDGYFPIINNGEVQKHPNGNNGFNVIPESPFYYEGSTILLRHQVTYQTGKLGNYNNMRQILRSGISYDVLKVEKKLLRIETIDNIVKSYVHFYEVNYTIKTKGAYINLETNNLDAKDYLESL